MSWVADKVSDTVSDVAGFVSDTTSDVLDFAVNTVENVIKNPALLIPLAFSIAIPGAGAAIGSSFGLTGTAAAAAGGAVIGGGASALAGGDVLSGALLGGVGAGASSYFNSQAATGADNIFSDSTSGDFDLPSYDPTATDYSLAPGASTGASGFKTPFQSSSGWDGSSPVDYSFQGGSSDGLRFLGSPSLSSMGGGQGFTVPVDGGVVGSLGFTPTGASRILGDPRSFINNASVLGRPVMGMESQGMTAQQQSDLLKQAIKSFGAAGTAGLMGSSMSFPQQGQQPAYQPASTMPNYSPEYFQQVQQKYDQIAPAMPADVATPLSEWYNKTPYQPSIVSKLFGVI